MIDENDRHYISLLQDNINRMASNSSNCKTWLITLVAAITALQLTTEDLRNILWIAVVLVVLFYLVDSYYLSLERKFIELEKEFVALCKTKEENKDALTDRLYCFDIKPQELLLGNGYFAILFPQDGHMPQLCVNKLENVKKVVVKVIIGE